MDVLLCWPFSLRELVQLCWSGPCLKGQKTLLSPLASQHLDLRGLTARHVERSKHCWQWILKIMRKLRVVFLKIVLRMKMGLVLQDWLAQRFLLKQSSSSKNQQQLLQWVMSNFVEKSSAALSRKFPKWTRNLIPSLQENPTLYLQFFRKNRREQLGHSSTHL